MQEQPTIQERLARLREKYRTDNTGLAARLNLSFYAVNAWDKGTRKPSRLALAAIEKEEMD